MMFMAACFCAYVRKMTQLQIAPLLNYSNEQITQNFFSNIKSVAELMNTKLILQNDSNKDIVTISKTANEDELLTQQSHYHHHDDNNDDNDNWRVFMPIISPFD